MSRCVIIKEGAPADLCRARGCGSYLRGLEREIHDGTSACCARCGREHTFTVFGDSDDSNANTLGVTIERKPRRAGAR